MASRRGFKYYIITIVIVQIQVICMQTENLDRLAVASLNRRLKQTSTEKKKNKSLKITNRSLPRRVEIFFFFINFTKELFFR